MFSVLVLASMSTCPTQEIFNVQKLHIKSFLHLLFKGCAMVKQEEVSSPVLVLQPLLMPRFGRRLGLWSREMPLVGNFQAVYLQQS